MSLTSESADAFDPILAKETRYADYTSGTNFFGNNTLPRLQAVVFNMTMYKQDDSELFKLQVPGPEEPQHIVKVTAPDGASFDFVQQIDPETKAVTSLEMYAGDGFLVGAAPLSRYNLQLDPGSEDLMIRAFVEWADRFCPPDKRKEFAALINDTVAYLEQTIAEEGLRGVPAAAAMRPPERR